MLNRGSQPPTGAEGRSALCSSSSHPLFLVAALRGAQVLVARGSLLSQSDRSSRARGTDDITRARSPTNEYTIS